MSQQQILASVLEELVGAIELRDASDPDSHDWMIEARIRTLERRLVEVHRIERTPYAMRTEDDAPALVGMF